MNDIKEARGMEKVYLTQEDMSLGPTALAAKYNLSGRGGAYAVKKRGYFVKDNHKTIENISLDSHWFGKNLKFIEKEVKDAFLHKIKQKSALLNSHRLGGFFLKDLYQEAMINVYLRSGDAENGQIGIFNLACLGIDRAIKRYFMYRDGGNNVSKVDFWDDQGKFAGYDIPEEESIDSLFLQVKEEIISQLGEKEWDTLWGWAISRKTKVPTEIMTKLEEVII